ncbi:hypothetical protein ACTFIZ_004125 [Dictyostelium cf. discoideum]
MNSEYDLSKSNAFCTQCGSNQECNITVYRNFKFFKFTVLINGKLKNCKSCGKQFIISDFLNNNINNNNSNNITSNLNNNHNNTTTTTTTTTTTIATAETKTITTSFTIFKFTIN